MKTYDLIIIGFGKAGKTLAVKYASIGKKVAVVEENSEMYGGTCINIGCIPTKTLIVAANENKNYTVAKETRDNVVGKMRLKNFNMLNENSNIDLYTAKAKFTSDKVIEIVHENDKLQLTAELIVINTGATSNIPNISGIKESKNVFNSTELQQLSELPKNLAILGGGNIGLEFASLYSKLGSKVTIFEPGAKILKREEDIISDLAMSYLADSGVTFKFNTEVVAIGNEDEQVIISTSEGNKLTFDAMLYATGRKPNTINLGLENTSITLSDNGAIEVNKYCETSVKNVFAVGDVTGAPQFTYTSLDDFRILVSYLLGDKSYSREERTILPYTIFINPPLSRVGLTEKEAIDKGYNILTKELPVSNMPRAVVNGDIKGLFKTIIDKDTNLILGATLFGRNSEELINIIKMAIDNKIPYTYFKNQIFTHPTMAENLNDLFNI